MTGGRIAINPDEVMAWSGKLKSLSGDIETASQAARQLGGLQLPPDAQPIATAVLSDTRILQGGSETFEVVSAAARAMAMGAEKADAADGGDDDGVVEISGKALEFTKAILGGVAANLIHGSNVDTGLRLVDMLIGTTAAVTGAPVVKLAEQIEDWRGAVVDGMREGDGVLGKIQKILSSKGNEELDEHMNALLGRADGGGEFAEVLSKWFCAYAGVDDAKLAVPAFNALFKTAAETAGKYLIPVSILSNAATFIEGVEEPLSVHSALETVSGESGLVGDYAAVSLGTDWEIPGADLVSGATVVTAYTVSAVTGLLGDIFGSSPSPPPPTMAQRLQKAYANDPTPPWDQPNHSSVGPIFPGMGSPSTFGHVG